MPYKRNLKIALDEDSQSKILVAKLADLGFDVATANTLDMSGQADRVVPGIATREGRALLTRNCRDFMKLHLADNSHSGLLLDYYDRHPLGPDEIALAIANISVAFEGDISRQALSLKPFAGYR